MRRVWHWLILVVCLTWACLSCGHPPAPVARRIPSGKREPFPLAKAEKDRDRDRDKAKDKDKDRHKDKRIDKNTVRDDDDDEEENERAELADAHDARDWFISNRVVPGETELPLDRYYAARDQIKLMPAFSLANSSFVEPTKGTRELAGRGWTSLGPGNIGGRTRSLVVHPTNPSVMYAGAVT